jgi:hypothetical protein
MCHGLENFNMKNKNKLLYAKDQFSAIARLIWLIHWKVLYEKRLQLGGRSYSRMTSLFEEAPELKVMS